jgi:hypothetical protein
MILLNSLPEPGKTQNGKTTTKPSTKGGNANRRNVATGIASQQIRLDHANESVRDYGNRIMNSKRRINKSMSACSKDAIYAINPHRHVSYVPPSIVSSSHTVVRTGRIGTRQKWTGRPIYPLLKPKSKSYQYFLEYTGCLSLDSPKRARNAMGVFFSRSILHILPGT